MNSDIRHEPWLLGWIPWMAAAAVFALVLVLDRVGVLPRDEERMLQINLLREVPRLREQLVGASISSDGRIVIIRSRDPFDDQKAMKEKFTKRLQEMGVDPGVIGEVRQLNSNHAEIEFLVRRWFPWVGLALGIGMLCHLWIRLGAMSRVLVMSGPSEPSASSVSLSSLQQEVRGQFRGIESAVKKQITSVESAQVRLEAEVNRQQALAAELAGRLTESATRLKELAAEVKGIQEQGLNPESGALSSQLEGIVAGLDEVRRGIQAVQVSHGELKADLGAVRSSLGDVVKWKAEMAPHLEAFGEEARKRIEDRERFRKRAVQAVDSVEAIQPLPRDTERYWEAGWAKLARQMGVRELEPDSGLKSAIQTIVRKLAEGPERALMLESAPKIGKGAILKALPWFFGYGAVAPGRIKTVDSRWYAEAVEGYDAEEFEPGILPAAIVEAIEEGKGKGCPWVFIDELGELNHGFHEVFSGYKENLFALGPEERRVRLFSRSGTEIVLPLPDAFRVVMARNPSRSGFVDHGEFDVDAAWPSRVTVIRIPPLCAASEESLLRRWIAWSRMPADERDPKEFFGHWQALGCDLPEEETWLPRFCRVLEASRVSHTRLRDPGWKYAETGTGVTRSLIWDAAAGGHEGFEQRLAKELSEKVVPLVRRHVTLEPRELAGFQEVLHREGFGALATQLG